MKNLSKILITGLMISLFSICGMFGKTNPANDNEMLLIVCVSYVEPEIIGIEGHWGDGYVQLKWRCFSESHPTHDEGVIINGIRWATRNVDTPGRFTKHPENQGMFYQWNRRKGWTATGRQVEDWDNSTPTGTAWYAENDPCPQGWRVPTYEELQSLYDSGSIWVSYNRVGGRLFGTEPNQIFLPGAGWRNSEDGAYYSGLGKAGHYWSSTQHNYVRFARSLQFGHTNITRHNRANGFNIRCVAK